MADDSASPMIIYMLLIDDDLWLGECLPTDADNLLIIKESTKESFFLESEIGPSGEPNFVPSIIW